VTTGSGGALPGWLIGTAGASACVLDLQVPYVHAALAEYLGRKPSQFVSSETAAAMAERALARSKELWLRQNGGEPGCLVGHRFVGVASTAAIVSVQPKNGVHRAFVCGATERGVFAYRVTFAKGRDRTGEDALVSRLMVRALLEASGHGSGDDWNDGLEAKNSGDENGGDANGGGDMERVAATYEAKGDALAALLTPAATPPEAQGAAFNVLHVPDGRGGKMAAFANYLPPVRTVVYPGSFNPLHDGHLALAKRAQARLGGSIPLVFELAAVNVDKPPLSHAAVTARVQQFAAVGAAVVVTKAPRFLEKARLFPGCAFVIGADTAKRLLDTKYYGSSVNEMVAALSEIKHLGCVFVVGGREEGGKFLTLEDCLAPLDLPVSIREMFIGLSVDEFRMDVSSTELRKAAAAKEAPVK
jgi:nicotinic acid mononucleotide adenylyltransferase